MDVGQLRAKWTSCGLVIGALALAHPPLSFFLFLPKEPPFLAQLGAGLRLDLSPLGVGLGGGLRPTKIPSWMGLSSHPRESSGGRPPST